MNKVEYLDVLKDYLLKYYSEEESLDILRDYEEYFLNGKLDGKTEQEIILELGSPKIIVQDLRSEEKTVLNKQGILSKLAQKFDKWFEKNLSDRYSSGEIEIMENRCDKVIEKYGIFAFMFLAIFSVIEVSVGLRFLTGITEILGVYIISMSFLVRTNKGLQSKGGKILTFTNILFMIFYLVLMFRGTSDIFNIGLNLAFFMAILNLILIFLFSNGMFFLIIISLFFAIMLIILGGIWFLFIGITIFGVGLAITLTPITLTALSSLSLSILWIIFPIMLAMGLFIAMSILIKYYSILIYRLVLKYNDWIKIKFMYSRVYGRKTKEDEYER